MLLQINLRNISKAGNASEAAMAATGVPSTSQKAPANATQPVGSVNTSQRLRHTISWTDSASPDNKKRPRGTIGCEIFNKLDGPPPVDEKECTYLALDSQSLYLAEYPGTDAGKMATTCSAGACKTAQPAPGPKPSAPPSPDNRDSRLRPFAVLRGEAASKVGVSFVGRNTSLLLRPCSIKLGIQRLGVLRARGLTSVVVKGEFK